eukprot:3939170-Rhodomonas_salina.4
MIFHNFASCRRTRNSGPPLARSRKSVKRGALAQPGRVGGVVRTVQLRQKSSSSEVGIPTWGPRWAGDSGVACRNAVGLVCTKLWQD